MKLFTGVLRRRASKKESGVKGIERVSDGFLVEGGSGRGACFDKQDLKSVRFFFFKKKMYLSFSFDPCWMCEDREEAELLCSGTQQAPVQLLSQVALLKPGREGREGGVGAGGGWRLVCRFLLISFHFHQGFDS